jgi:MOSC domain-containing protein
MQVGSVKQIWSYPVKSLGGEILDEALVDGFGMIGDRNWSLVDTATGDLASGKSVPRLMNLQARYQQGSPTSRLYADDVPDVEVIFPDGRVITGQEAASAAISEYTGKSLRLHPLEAPDLLEHYRMSAPLDESRLASIFNIRPGEDGPDLSDYEPELIGLLSEFSAPPGTYYDMFPLHLVTSASVEHFTNLSGANFDPRRFRPSIYVESASGSSGLAEFEWVGRNLRIGELELAVKARTIRCSMPARGQEQYGLEASPATTKAIYQTTNRYLGVYLSVVTPGSFKTGDTVNLVQS